MAKSARTTELQAEAVALYAEGLTLTKIAARLGITQPYVSRLIKEAPNPPPAHPHHRKGNGQTFGVGWGGPANGTAPSFTALTQPAMQAKADGQGKAKTLREMAEPLLPRVVEVWKEVMEDIQAPPGARVIAADKIAERGAGKVGSPFPEELEQGYYDLSHLSADELRELAAALETVQRLTAKAPEILPPA